VPARRRASRPRVGSQKSKQQPELACGSNQIVITEQLGQLLFEVALCFSRPRVPGAEPSQHGRANRGHEGAEIREQQQGGRGSEQLRVRVALQVLSDEATDIRPAYKAIARGRAESRKVLRAESA